jgi:hypothetical protein
MMRSRSDSDMLNEWDEPVDNLQAVKVLQSEKKFGSVESAPDLVESAFALKVVEQLSPVDCECE